MNILLLGVCLLATTLGAALNAAETGSSVQSRKIVILLGPPGSGKGTQAVRLSKELGIPHISTGDLFRDNLSRNTPLGQKAKTYMESGKLVPDEVVLEMLFDRVSRPDCQKGYLLDGFPRTIPQAEALDKQLSKNDQVIALDLQVKDELIVKRISGRLTCKANGHIQNKYFSPPKMEGVCDVCQGELIQRADDSADVVKERLRVYHEQTEPLISFYQKKGVLKQVNGENDPETVYKELLKNLK
jgi:adenylate kinase